MVKKLTTEEFISKAKAIHGDKYSYDKVVYVNSHTEVEIVCNNCNRIFKQLPNNHLHGQGCSYCNNSKYKYIDQDKFIEECKKVHGDNYDYDRVIYKGMREKIEIYCKKCKKYFWQLAVTHIKGGNCLHDKIPTRWTQESFIQKAKELHGDKYNYSEIIYKNMDSEVKIFCNRCKKYFMQTPWNHLHGSDCKCYLKEKLHNSQAWSLDKFIENAKRIHKGKYDYSLVEYYNCKTPVTIICNKCHKEFLQTPDAHLLGKGCPRCCNSSGENIIEEWLTNHMIEYKREYWYKDCRDIRPLPFDFYLPIYNLCIEYQGEQHYESGKRFFINKNNDVVIGEKEFSLQKKHDRIKKKYCKDNNINFLEIKYNENIEKKLQECLDKLDSN